MLDEQGSAGDSAFRASLSAVPAARQGLGPGLSRERRRRWTVLAALMALLAGTGIYWWSMGFIPGHRVALAQPFGALASFAGGLLIGLGLLVLLDTVSRGFSRSAG